MNGDYVSIVDPAARHAEVECFNRIALVSKHRSCLHLPVLSGTNSFKKDQKPKAILILGSATSVCDNPPWQQALVDWLKPLMEQGVPTLGICYGHQLIAHLWGGLVDFAYTDNRKLTGHREITFSGSRLWTDQVASLVVSHREVVMQVPKGMRKIAQSSEVAIEGLEHETLPVFTIQAHPEATEGFLENNQVTPPPPSLKPGHQLVQNFLDSL